MLNTESFDFCYYLTSHQPLLATTVLVGIIATLKPYPTLGDAGLYIGLASCFPEVWDGELCMSPKTTGHVFRIASADITARRSPTDLRHPLLTASLHLYSLILLPLLHSLWIESGTGNANFFYAATLVYGLGCGLGVIDFLGAGMKARIGQTVVESQGLVGTDQRSGQQATEVESAKSILERNHLVIVQYPGLPSDGTD